MEPENQELDQGKLDEQACGERINYWLKKYGCTLHGVAILENGSVRVQVGVQKLPPDIIKEMKQAEKHEQVAEAPADAEPDAPSQA